MCETAEELRSGVDTYCTVEEADKYVVTTYQKYAPLRVIWSVLDSEEMTAYLRMSLAEIECLPFVGVKYNTAQPLAFPRLPPECGISYYGRACGLAFLGKDYSAIPQEIKFAQAENALAIIGKECMAQTDKQFMIMQTLGLMKNIKYNKREAGDVGMGDDIKGASRAASRLTSKTADKYLRAWLGGLRV